MLKKYSLSPIFIAQQSISQKLFLVVLWSLLFCSISSFSATYYSRAGSGSWSNPSTWSSSCGGLAAAGIPAAGDDVVICSGTIVNITANQFITNVTVNSGGALTLNTTGKILTVSGNYTSGGNTNFNATSTTLTIGGNYTMNGGNTNFNVGSTTLTVSGNFTMNDGNVSIPIAATTTIFTVSGNFTMNGGLINLVGNPSTLTVGGDFTMNNPSTAIAPTITGSGPNRLINVMGSFFINTTTGISAKIGNASLNVRGTFIIATGASVILNGGSTGSKTFGHFFNNGTWSNTSNNVPITINGNFENNGTFNNGTGKVTFTGATFNTVSGTAPLTTFDTIVVNKGTSATVADQNNVLDVQSKITLGSGKLFLNRGTFKLSSASIIVPFSTSNDTIQVNARLWNNGGTINHDPIYGFNWWVRGTLQNSAGTINAGLEINNTIAPSGAVVISGGAVNVTGRISMRLGIWSYTMSGGILTLGTVGNDDPESTLGGGFDPFNMDNVSGSFTMTGGRIIIVKANNGSGTEYLGFKNIATAGGGFTGGTLQIGTVVTPAATGTIKVQTSLPIYNLEVVGNNTTALITPPTGVLPATTSLTITNDVTITSGILDIGTNNQDLFVGGNWTNTSTIFNPFIEGTKKVTFNGTSGTQTISSSGLGAVNGTTFYDLTINNTSLTVPQVKTTANVVVRNTLTLTRGKVNLSGNTLTLGTGVSSALCGTLSFPAFTPSTAVQPITWMYGGTFKRWFRTTALPIRNIAGLFPFGSATDYHPFWLNYSTALTTGGTFSVTHDPSGSGSVAIPNYPDPSCGLTIEGISNARWGLSTNVAPNGNTLGITYGGFGFANFLATDLNASNVSGTAGNCSSPSNVNPGIYFEVNRSALSLAQINNAWYIGTSNLNQSPLPIELLSFDANSNQQVVDLNWSTASETNSDYYTIEKTRDGYNFETVVTMDAAGNSNALLHYATKDNSPYQGISYYRLKQTDFNGAFTYSDLQMVDFNSNQAFSFEIYPNPADGSIFNIAFNSGFNENFIIVVRDMMGRECYSKTFYVQENQKNSFAIDPYTDLVKGIYLVSVRSMNRSQNKLLTIQ